MELVSQGAAYPESKETQSAVALGWMKVQAPASRLSVAISAHLDPGEAEAIALAKQLNALLLIDEADGRRIAAQLGIHMTGTLGLLIEAKARGLISSVAVELERLTRLTTFRISDELRTLVLRQAGEKDAGR
jgi:predicted nucleic acid-binding protein